MNMGIRIDRYGAIELSGMEFHSFHGCLEEERREGNTFVVDFLGNMDVLKAARTDDLNNTVDYSKIYRTVAKEMEKPSNLLENVAARIADAIDHEFQKTIRNLGEIGSSGMKSTDQLIQRIMVCK